MQTKCIQKLLKRQLLTQRQICTLCRQLSDLLLQQPNILSLSAPIIICGDIHGQYFDLLQLFQKGGPLPSNQYLFLGDYVDRGYHSTQTVLLLFAYKLKYKENFHLLRGNHECKSLTQIYGFYDEVFRKYGNINPWRYITRAFQYLPLAAKVEGNCQKDLEKILCVHGGLSPDLPMVDDIYLLERVAELGEKGPLADLLWSDPDHNVQSWCINPRGAGYLFSQKNVHEYNHLNNLQTIIRAHQLVQDGYTYNFLNDCLLTVWSAPNYCYRCGNNAAIVVVDKSRNKSFIQFDASQDNDKYNVSNQNVLPYFL